MPDSRSNNPLDTLWQGPSMLSVVFIGEAVAALLALAPGFLGDRWVYFGLASLMIQWVILLSLGLLFIFRHALSNMKPIRVSWLALGILLASSIAVASGAWFLMELGLTHLDVSLPVFLSKIVAIALLVGMLSLAAFQNHWQARQLAVKAKQAELEALTARIRPHFLFNTLNAGASLIHGRPEEAERLLLNLADLFRAALSGQQEIRLEEEMELAKGYVEIESLRFADRLNMHWDLPSPLPNIMVPTLSIQPLIENAIKHGMEPSSTRVNVEVIVKQESNIIKIYVINDMPKLKPTIITGHQVGLLSSRERIRALSLGRAELNTRIENDRFIAVINLPLKHDV
jgi:two-component system, LytTR family, sensor histidine kinase AlgZ